MPHTMSSMERTAGKQTCSDRIQNTSYAKDEKESAGNAHSPFRFIAAFLYGVLSNVFLLASRFVVCLQKRGLYGDYYGKYWEEDQRKKAGVEPYPKRYTPFIRGSLMGNSLSVPYFIKSSAPTTSSLSARLTSPSKAILRMPYCLVLTPKS